MARIRIYNQHAQAHTIQIKKEDGRFDSRILPARGFVELDSKAMTQSIYDFHRRGVVRLVAVDPPERPEAPASAPQKPKAASFAPEPIRQVAKQA
jgi:hypothetical protein